MERKLRFAVLLLTHVLGAIQGSDDDSKFSGHVVNDLNDRNIYPDAALMFDVPIDSPDLASEICDYSYISCDKVHSYTIDGSCNNEYHPYVGAAGQKYSRILPPKYHVELEKLREGGRLYNSALWNANATMPNARYLSANIFETEGSGSDPGGTDDVTSGDYDADFHFVSAFAAFVNHDLSLYPVRKSIDCCNEELHDVRDCARIIAPFTESSPDDLDGDSSGDLAIDKIELEAESFQRDCDVWIDGEFYSGDFSGGFDIDNKFDTIAVVCFYPDGSGDIEDHLYTPQADGPSIAPSTPPTDTRLGFTFTGTIDGVEKVFTENAKRWRCTDHPGSTQWYQPSFVADHWRAGQDVPTHKNLVWMNDDKDEPVRNLFCRYERETDFRKFWVTGTGRLWVFVNGYEKQLENSEDPTRADHIYVSNRLSLGQSDMDPFRPEYKIIFAVRLAIKYSSDSGMDFRDQYKNSGILFDSNFRIPDTYVRCLASNDPEGPVDKNNVAWTDSDYDDGNWREPEFSRRNDSVNGISHNHWIIAEGTRPNFMYCRIYTAFPERCMNYKRTLPWCNDPGTAGYSLREQVNFQTGILDLGNVYGTTRARQEQLRSTNGELKVIEGSGTVGCVESGDTSQGQLEMHKRELPFDTDGPLLQLSGDNNHVKNPWVQAFTTLFVREHNRIASKLRTANSTVSDDAVYDLARRITIAEYQSVIYNEFLPVLLGTDAMDVKSGTQYDVSIKLGTTVTADLILDYITADSAQELFPQFSITQSQVVSIPFNLLVEDFFSDSSPDIGFVNTAEPCFTDEILRGLLEEPDHKLDRKIPPSLLEKFFGHPDDYMARMIQRGRDFGVREFDRYRKFCGLNPRMFEEDEIPFNSYHLPNDIDFIVGAVLEEDEISGDGTALPEGGILPETMKCLLKYQFKILSLGDRFFYSHTEQKNGDRQKQNEFKPFSLEQRTYFNERTLMGILCDNIEFVDGSTGDGVRRENVFDKFSDSIICDNVRSFDESIFPFPDQPKF